MHWTVDTLAPDAPVITSPSSGSTLALDTPTLTGTAEPGAWVTVSVDGVVVGTVQANSAGEWSLPPSTVLPDGPHQATATATDAAGNVSTDSAPVDFVVDTVAPIASMIPGIGMLAMAAKAAVDIGSSLLEASGALNMQDQEDEATQQKQQQTTRAQRHDMGHADQLINRIVDPLNLTGGAPAQAMQGLFGGLGNIV